MMNEKELLEEILKELKEIKELMVVLKDKF